jgi:hypothetical protein
MPCGVPKTLNARPPARAGPGRLAGRARTTSGLRVVYVRTDRRRSTDLHQRLAAAVTRFKAPMPNECWQADFTHYRLTRPDGRDGADSEILSWLDDDCSRYALRVTAHVRVTGPIVRAAERLSPWRTAALDQSSYACTPSGHHQTRQVGRFGTAGSIDSEVAARLTAVGRDHRVPYSCSSCTKTSTGPAERADVCALGVPTATYDKSRPADLVGVVMQVLHGVGHGPGTDDVLDRG